MIDAGLYITYIMMLIAFSLALFFPFKYLIQHPSEAKFTFAGIGVVVVILILGYAIAPGDYSFKGMEVFKLSTNAVKIIGGGLNALYILMGISVIATVYFEVTKMVK